MMAGPTSLCHSGAFAAKVRVDSWLLSGADHPHVVTYTYHVIQALQLANLLSQVCISLSQHSDGRSVLIAVVGTV